MSLIKVYYLYSTEPGNSGMRYIGQTKRSLEKRLAVHRSGARKSADTYIARWIRSVCESGYEVRIGLLKSNAIWNADEMAMIKKYRALGYRLTNSTDGGDGIMNPSAETRLKMSVSGKKKIFSDEHRVNLSKSHKRENLSQETLKKMSEGSKRRAPASLDTRRKRSENAKRQWRNSEFRTKMEGCVGSEHHNYGRHPSANTRRKMSEHSRWHREKLAPSMELAASFTGQLMEIGQ
jgi:hypothetical protein